MSMKKFFLFFIGIIFLGCKENNSSKTEESFQAEAIPTYNFEELEKQLPQTDDKVYVVNFWATWCAPCVEELPFLTMLDEKEKEVEVILVSLDMPKMKDTHLKPFVEKNKIKSKVMLLDDPYSNKWIPKIDENWDGAIPATLIYNSKKKKFYPKKFDTYQELLDEVQKFENVN